MNWSRLLVPISDLRTIVAAVVVCIACFITFFCFRNRVGGKYLDEVVTSASAQKIIDRLNDVQRRWHIWLTILLDTVFPVSYGLLLAGLTLRFANPQHMLLVLPACLTVLADIGENRVQVRMLRTGIVSSTKLYFSAAKWSLLVISVVVLLMTWLV